MAPRCMSAAGRPRHRCLTATSPPAGFVTAGLLLARVGRTRGDPAAKVGEDPIRQLLVRAASRRRRLRGSSALRSRLSSGFPGTIAGPLVTAPQEGLAAVHAQATLGRLGTVRMALVAVLDEHRPDPRLEEARWRHPRRPAPTSRYDDTHRDEAGTGGRVAWQAWPVSRADGEITVRRRRTA